MELRQILNLIGKWIWLVILSVAIAAGSSYFASRAATPLYRTKTTLMVGQATRNPDPNSADLYTGQQLAYTYSQLARREPVIKGAIESLGLQMRWESLVNQVSANIVPQTQLLEISVIDIDPYRAKVIADAVAQQLILQSPAGAVQNSTDDINFIREQVDELQNKIEIGQADLERLRQELDASNSALQIQDLQNQINLLETKISNWQNTYSQLLLSMQGGDVNVLTVVEEATVPGRPISPNIQMNVLVAAAIGLALAIGGVFLMEYLDDTIKTPDEVERATNLPTIGVIVQIDGKTNPDKLIAARDPYNPVVEGFRALRNNIQYSAVGQPYRVLLITSAGPSEGKSLILANLAVVMANAGQRVILVDSDFRRPTQNEIFNLPNESGLSSAIINQNSSISNFLQNVGIENLSVLTCGPLPPHPNRLLESSRMRDVLKEFDNQADVVLFDSPPLMAVSDAAILGTQVDGVLLVVDAGRTRANDIRLMVKEMKRVHIPLIGVILNRANRNGKNSYYYYYRRNNGSDNHSPAIDLVRSKSLGWFTGNKSTQLP
jgi:non-specific protein-tyrosine kinase